MPFRQHCRAVLLPHPNPPPSPRCLLAVPAPSCTFMTCSQHSLSNLQGKSAQPHVAHGEQFPFAPSSTQHPAAHLGTQLACGFSLQAQGFKDWAFFLFPLFFINYKQTTKQQRDVSCPVQGYPKSTSTNKTAPRIPNCSPCDSPGRAPRGAHTAQEWSHHCFWIQHTASPALLTLLFSCWRLIPGRTRQTLRRVAKCCKCYNNPNKERDAFSSHSHLAFLKPAFSVSLSKAHVIQSQKRPLLWVICFNTFNRNFKGVMKVSALWRSPSAQKVRKFRAWTHVKIFSSNAHFKYLIKTHYD